MIFKINFWKKNVLDIFWFNIILGDKVYVVSSKIEIVIGR